MPTKWEKNSVPQTLTSTTPRQSVLRGAAKKKLVDWMGAERAPHRKHGKKNAEKDAVVGYEVSNLIQ
jgi:hypothetical protein